MKYHDKKFRKCKYCDKEVLRNIAKEGRNKGLYRTCGSSDCLKEQYKDKEVNKKKNIKNRNIIIQCSHCNNKFLKESTKQKWCKECAPTKSARIILSRYKISHKEHLKLLEECNKICCICLKKEANFIDHDHKTGKVRGIICCHCNTSLNLLEKKETLLRALKYLKYESFSF